MLLARILYHGKRRIIGIVKNEKTPAEDGFAMPAEWGEHSACWMAWPCRAEVWGGARGLAEARLGYAATARAVGEFESVRMLANSEDAAAARAALNGNAEIVPMPIDDSWLRDNGATFVRGAGGEIAGINWRFNAWGEKYRLFENDDAAAAGMLRFLRMRRFDAPLVMEGGSFHTDGEGTALTTEQCLLHPNRNPSLSRAEIESQLRAHLGCEKTIWLAGDERDEETDGHIDNLACFCAPGEVLAMESGGDSVLEENIRRLRDATDAKGRKLQLRLLPKPSVRENGCDLLASYINFYPANGGIVMPSFGVAEDEKARAIIAESFPGRRVAQVDARAIVRGGGGIHCITQQQPAGEAAPPKEKETLQ